MPFKFQAIGALVIASGSALAEPEAKPYGGYGGGYGGHGYGKRSAEASPAAYGGYGGHGGHGYGKRSAEASPAPYGGYGGHGYGK